MSETGPIYQSLLRDLLAEVVKIINQLSSLLFCDTNSSFTLSRYKKICYLLSSQLISATHFIVTN